METSNTLDKYATHLPILYLLSRFFKFEYIHEFGIGMNSTPVLCDKEVYNVKRVTSYEDDVDWFKKIHTTVRELNKKDDHIVGVLASYKQMASLYSEYEFAHAGKRTLTLVDNSDEVGRRHLIKSIVSNSHFGSHGCITVFHDAEWYKDLLADIKTNLFETFLFDALLPNTMIVFGFTSQTDLRRRKMNEFLEVCRDFNGWLKECITLGEQNLKLPPLNDKEQWLELLESESMYAVAIKYFTE